VLRRLPHFLLLGVDAAVETRFRRALERGRPGDPRTLEEFRSREREENRPESHRQQLAATFALADLVVHNDGDLGALRRAVDALLEGLPAARTR
jgi:dephospho-CoA kinase